MIALQTSRKIHFEYYLPWIVLVIITLSPFVWCPKSTLFDTIFGLFLGGFFLFSYFDIKKSLSLFLIIFLFLPGFSRFLNIQVPLILPFTWTMIFGWFSGKNNLGSIIWNNKIDINKPIVLFLSIITLSFVITMLRCSGLTYGFFFSTPFIVAKTFFTNETAIFSILTIFFSYAAGPFFFWMILSVNYRLDFMRKALTRETNMDFTRFVKGINLGIFLTLLFATIQWIFPSLRINGYITALTTDSNALGASLVIAWPISLAIMIGNHATFHRVIAGISVLLGILILFPLGSRIAQGALIVNIIVFAFIFIWHKRLYVSDYALNKTIITAVGVIVIFVGLIIFAFSFTSENILKDWLFPLYKASKSNSVYTFLNFLFRPDRFQIIIQSVNMTKDYPLSGIGLGAFHFELSNFYRIYIADLKSVLAYIDIAHNYYLQISSELGLIGLFFVLWIMGFIMKKIWHGMHIKLSDSDRWLFYGVSSGLLSMQLFFIFEALLHFPDVNIIYWFAVGVLYNIFITNHKKYKLSIRENSAVVPVQKRDEPFFSRKALISWGVILMIFAVSLTYNSTHTLSVSNRQKLIGWEYIYGYWGEEEWSEGKVRWTGKKSLKEVQVKSSIMSFKLFCSHPDVKKRPVQADLWIDNKNVGQITFSKNEWREVNIQLPLEIGSKVKLKIEVSRTFAPYKWKINNDWRKLGVAITEIKWLDKLPERTQVFSL